MRDAACPLSTRGGTRLVRLVRGKGGEATRTLLRRRARSTLNLPSSSSVESPSGTNLRWLLSTRGVYSRDMGRGNTREGGRVEHAVLDVNLPNHLRTKIGSAPCTAVFGGQPRALRTQRP